MKWTRRHVVGTAVAAAALAGCLGDDGDDDGDDGAENTDGSNGDEDGPDASAVLEEHDLEDYTGEDEVEIAVDPDGGFAPQAVEIDSDTIINWNWEGESTEVYPIDIPDPCVWDEEVDEETVEMQAAGDEADRLFWAEGAYLYGSHNEDGEEFLGAFRVLEVDDE